MMLMWKWYWDEMMLMLTMTLRWDLVDVENVIAMMYDVYVHGGAVIMMDIPSEENIVVKCDCIWCIKILMMPKIETIQVYYKIQVKIKRLIERIYDSPLFVKRIS